MVSMMLVVFISNEEKYHCADNYVYGDSDDVGRVFGNGDNYNSFMMIISVAKII
jgi:hypothetical protein